MTWTQVYDPTGHWWLSTLIAALPIIVLLGLLAGFKVRAHLCAIAGAATAVIIAIVAFKMPAVLAMSSFFYGAAFGLLKIVWIVIAAVFLYDISVATGQFEIMKQSVAAITPDRRLQLLLVAFCFGAFIEGCAGFGAPVAIAGAFMIGLGFKPFQAAALNLIANTSPVAWGAIGTPVHTLAAVTLLNESDLNAMIGRILPITALIVPMWLVRTMVSWKETIEVLPAILVVGGSFAATQWYWANHVDSNLVDISAGIVSLVVTLLFLQVWRPKNIWRFADEPTVDESVARSSIKHYSPRQIARAWMPFAILSIFVLCWDFPQSRLRSTRPRRLRSKSSCPMASRAPVHPDGTGHIFTGKFREPRRSSPSPRLKLRDSTSIGSPRLEPAVFLLRFSPAFCLGSDSAGSAAFSVERWFDYVSQLSR